MSLKVVTKNLDSKGFENVYIQYGHGGDSKRLVIGPKGLKVKQGGMEDERLVKCAGAAWKEHNASITDGNEAIDKAKSSIQFIIRRFAEDYKEAITPDVLHEMWEAERAPKQGNAPAGAKVTFWQLFKDYEAGLLGKVKDSEKDGYNTARSLKPLGSLLMEFEQARGVKLTLASFDYALMTAFNDFMLSKGHRNATTNVRMGLLKTLLNHWVKTGVSKHVAFREYRRPKKHKNAPTNQQIVALNAAELDELIALDLDCKHLRYARALFCLCAATGLRYSDAVRVSPADIRNENFVITTQKTKETLTIPLNWLSRKVLAEYPEGMRSLDLGQYNARLIKLGEMCPSLHKSFKRITFSGVTAVSDATKTLKYQHLSSHVGRKTFVCLCLMKGIPEFKIRHWTGHKDLTSFSHYVDGEMGQMELMSRF